MFVFANSKGCGKWKEAWKGFLEEVMLVLKLEGWGGMKSVQGGKEGIPSSKDTVVGMQRESPNPTSAESLCEKKQNTCWAWKLEAGFLEALNARPQTTGSIWEGGSGESHILL